MNTELIIQLASLILIVASGPIVIGLLSLKQGNL
uniref:Photosystem II reaction center protein Psb30 n=1 Tax=Lepocinclis ovum TaxID=86638 RepID=A0A3G3LM18_9EUGL|nr:photosystem II reaction center protein [Lepocinclis ovum]AYQ93765.1 photosystem II reaction center protein [Lepocinclis ovum]